MAGFQIPDSSAIPRHVAMIMDGNGRFAKEQGKNRLEGHRAGAGTVRMVVEESRSLGVRYLTLFSFSTENWGRSAAEIKGLMTLFVEFLENEIKNKELLSNGIRLRAIGDLSRLPLAVRLTLDKVMKLTENKEAINKEGMDLVLALSYGGREDLLNACKRVAEEVKDGTLDSKEIDHEVLSKRLWTAGLPEPDLLIRTGGESRISNFFLWQFAYTELIFIPDLWPAFSRERYRECIQEYQARERRFGLTSEQIQELSRV